MIDLVPNNVSWDMFGLSLAFLASCKSRDPGTKVGCVALLDDKSIFMGYNGCPAHYNDDLLNTEDKHSHVLHAESNCLDMVGLERARSQKNLTLYITIHPCPKCALKLVHFNVKRVVYYSEYKSTVNDDNLLEKIRWRGGLSGEAAFQLEKYEGESLLFCHSHMGIKTT